MIRILIFLLLNTYIFSIDTGCIPQKPALCRINPITHKPICKEKYEACEGFEGCTDPQYPYLCSNGDCAESFSKCNIKYFNCNNLKLYNK